MLGVIVSSANPIGIKLSGGVSSFAQANELLNIIMEYKTLEYIDFSTCRIGSSSLLNELSILSK